MNSKNPFRVVILASTRGSDFGAMLEEKRDGKLEGVEFVGLVSNKECGAIEKAQASGIPTFVLDGKSENYHAKLLEKVKELNPDLICMVGYMKILDDAFCDAFENKILNIHPSLLPKYGGGMDMDVYKEVLKNGEKETGMSIHLATKVVDGGEIICQKSVAIEEDDTPETLKEKVQALEKKWYPEVIRWFRDGKIYF